MASIDSATQRRWYIAQRWQQYAGEARANLLRIAAIGVFYVLHCWNYLGSQGWLPPWAVLQLGQGETVDGRFHLLATLLALSWILAAGAVHLSLSYRVFPSWISAASTAVDLVMLTCVLSISSGPRSPLVVGYFLIIALAGLRFSLPLVRLTTVGALAGYLCVLGVAKWPARFGRDGNIDLTVSRYEQLAMAAALALCGVFIGQIVRQARKIAQDMQLRDGV